MTTSNDPYRPALLRGILVNTLGMVIKSLAALWVPLATWLFGASVMGGYWLIVPVEEFCAALISSGLSDAATIYASHHVDEAATNEDAEKRLYALLGNIFFTTLALGIFLGITLSLSSELITHWVFPSHPEVRAGIRWLAWSIAPAAFIPIAVAATKAKLLMQYDPIVNGLVRPTILTVATLGCWSLSRSLESLMLALFISYMGTALACVVILRKEFDGKKLLWASLRPTWDGRIIGFALPQSLNLSLNRYIVRLDIVVLGWFGTSSAELALYGSAAWLTSQLRVIRTAFSGALSPIAARHHASGHHEFLARGLADMSRWSSTLVIIPVLLGVVLRDDVLSLVSREFPPNTAFVVILLFSSFVGTAFGIAGNALVFTGHSRYNLLNSSLVAVLNTVMAFLLVPRFGTLGAAIAVSTATVLITIAQAVELEFLERVEISPRLVYKPFVAMLPSLCLLVPFWDPAKLTPAWQRFALAAVVLLLYLGMLVVLRLEDLAAIRRNWNRWRKGK